MRWRRIQSGTVLAAALWLAACTTPPAAVDAAPEAASGFAPRPEFRAQRQIVAAAHPLAVDAGVRILREGGSAVDAAIAVQMVLTLVEPQSSGIGGGLFLVHHDGQAVTTFDGRETAPAAATPQLFLREGRPMGFRDALVGGRAVGVPGVLRALELAHARHGRLPWSRLFEPAITLARGGFPIGPRLAVLLREPGAAALRDDPQAAALFFRADGQPKAAGEWLRNPALADTLQQVAQQGADALHRGAIAQDIVDRVRGHAPNPGLLSLQDLAGYRAKSRAPLCFDYRAWRICGMAPPSSGTLAVAQLLGMLEPRDLASMPPVAAGFGLEPAAPAVHLLAEAGRLAFADRARFVADPDFVPLPGGSAAALLDPAYLARRAGLIGERSMGRAQPGRPDGVPVALADDRSPERPATSHLSIADAHGNTLAMTTTIENAFGAQLMVRGFLLNNQLTDFSFVPEEDGRPVANRVEPGKRPRSSMTPLLVFDRRSGGLRMSLGSPGGSSIIPYVSKMLVATLDWQMPLAQAVALPNFGSRNGPTELEAGRASAALAEALRARGHTISVIPQTSGVHAIARVQHEGRTLWTGAADPRREGTVSGD